MNKIKLQKIINSLLFIVFAVQVITSLFLLFNRGTEAIAEVHKYNGVLFIALAVIHIMLNWGWVRSVIFKKH